MFSTAAIADADADAYANSDPCEHADAGGDCGTAGVSNVLARDVEEERRHRHRRHRGGGEREGESRRESKRRRRLRQSRMRDLERDAASRTMNGNGADASLPPLPTATTISGAKGNDDGDNEDEGGGLGTTFGHPYGALPYGNIHFAAPPRDGGGDPLRHHPDRVRRSGLGPYLRFLNDDQVVRVLSYLGAPELGGSVVRTSRFLYASGHHDELWRDLTLREFGEVGIEMMVPPTATTSTGAEGGKEKGGGKRTDGTDPEHIDKDDDCVDHREEKKDDEAFTGSGDGAEEDDTKKGQKDDDSCGNECVARRAGCWKDAYAYNAWSKKKKGDIEEGGSRRDSPPPQRHTPFPVEGIYSDTLYRSWLCRSFALDPSWLSVQTVSVERSSDLSPERFLRDYECQNVPVLIRGASQHWPAVQRWKDASYLVDATAGATFRATSGVAPLPGAFAMVDYLSYCDVRTGAAEEAPLYLFDRTFASKCPRLIDDFDAALRGSCPYFDPDADHGHDLLGALGEGRRPDHQWIIVGPKRSGSSFHIDPNCTHAWNAPIVGRKRWIFYPPDGPPPPGVYPSPNGDDVAMPVSLGEWFLAYWNDHVRRRSDPNRLARPLECTARPGDVLFIPHGWWHAVLNLDDGPSVALTRNYVSASNLSDVLRFFDRRVGQVSGCRDRPGAIRPEDLGTEFRRALRKELEVQAGEQSEEAEVEKASKGGANDNYGGLKRQRRKRRWPRDLLDASEKEAGQGWRCAAWSDGASTSILDESAPTDNNCNGGKRLCHTQEHKDRRTDAAAPSSTSILARARMPQQSTSDNGGGGVDNPPGRGGSEATSEAIDAPRAEVTGNKAVGGFSFSFVGN